MKISAGGLATKQKYHIQIRGLSDNDQTRWSKVYTFTTVGERELNVKGWNFQGDYVFDLAATAKSAVQIWTAGAASSIITAEIVDGADAIIFGPFSFIGTTLILLHEDYPSLAGSYFVKYKIGPASSWSEIQIQEFGGS